MKKIIIFIFLLAILSQVLAININVEKQSSDETMIAELNKPVIFNLKITNYGPSDNFQFYNLLGFEMHPKGKIFINEGETKDVEIKIMPIGEFDYRGAYTFSYFIRGQDSSEIEKEMTFRIINLEDTFEIGSGEIDLESNSIEIYIHNRVNFDFQEIHTKFSSAFFNFEEDFSLEPNKRKNFDVQLNKEDFKKLTAGFYTLNAEVTVENKKADIEGTIKFAEKDLVTTTRKEYGFFISTEIVKKENEGNVLAESETVLKKNIISRLFTSFSPEPDIVEREGLTVYYTWDREIKPGESLEITVKTNWFLPLLVIFFIIAIVILVKQYSKTNLVLRKKISFVRTKGGEFALKVSILVSAKKYIERVSIVDRLPVLVKVHERFGGENPLRVDEKNRKIEWGFERLEPGETRLLSYIIYSKIGVLGKFALPSATAVYEKEGEIHESESNRAFFVSEQKKGEED